MDPKHNLTGKSIIDELSFDADSTLHPHEEDITNILNQVVAKPEENGGGTPGPVISNVGCNQTSTGPNNSAAEALFPMPMDTSSSCSSSEDILPQKPPTDPTPALTQGPSSSAVTQNQSTDHPPSSSISSSSKPILPGLEIKESAIQSDCKSENKAKPKPDAEIEGGAVSCKGKNEEATGGVGTTSCAIIEKDEKVEPKDKDKEDHEKEKNNQSKLAEKRKIEDDGMDEQEQSSAKQKSEKHEERLKMQKQKENKMTDEACSIGVQLNLECHKLDYNRSKGIENLSDLNQDVVETLLWRAGLKEHEGELSTICFHHKQYFGNVFERRAKTSKKCCSGLLQHKSKVKGERPISLVMAKELEVRGYNVTPGHVLCRQCVKKYKGLIDDAEEMDADYTCELLETPPKKT